MEHCIDPDVDQEYIDPSGELIDQVMDVMQRGCTFTIDGIHRNINIRKHMVDVFDCVKALESQELIELVDDDPPCWRLAGSSQKQGYTKNNPLHHHPMEWNIRREKEHKTQENPSNIENENDPPHYQPMEWNMRRQENYPLHHHWNISKETLMTKENPSNTPLLPMNVSSSPISNSQQGPQHASHSHTKSSMGVAPPQPSYQSHLNVATQPKGGPPPPPSAILSSMGVAPPQPSYQSHINVATQLKGGPPPPPSAILFQSLISQSNHPSAPVPISHGPPAQSGRPVFSSDVSTQGHIRPSAPYSPDEERSAFLFNGKQRGLNPRGGRLSSNPGNPGTRPNGFNQPLNSTPQLSMPQRSGFASYNQPGNSAMFSELQGPESSNSYQTGSSSSKTSLPSNHIGFNTGKSGVGPGFDNGKTIVRPSQTGLPTSQTSFQSVQTCFPPGQRSFASIPFPRPPTAEMFQSLANQGPQKMSPKGVTSANNRTPTLTPLQRQILDCMVKTDKPCETLQLARLCGMKTKKDVNPSIYQLQSWGLVSKMHDKPPTWKLRSDNMQLINSLTNSSSRSPANPPHASATSFTPAPHNRLSYDSSRPLNPCGKRNLSTEDFSTQKVPHFENQSQFSKGFPQAQEFSQSGSGGRSVDQGNQHQALSNIVHSSINRNPVSALNEYAQKNRLDLTYETINEKRGFAVAVVLGGRTFPAARASNSKDARREACDVALRSLLGQNVGSNTQLSVNQPSSDVLQGARTHFDLIAALSQHAFVQIAATIDENIAGRKVVACIVMKQGPVDSGKVVSVGTGNRCVTGERLSMEGKVVNDSHAEIVARRSLHRFLYAQIQSFHHGHDSIFEQRNSSSLLCLKVGVSFHLYISTAPCGDGALFTPRVDDAVAQPPSEDGSHSPEFTSKTQGILRTKIEDGEGTIPIDPNDGPQTWDGLLRGQRLRTMSCSDKICRWNVVGIQGALLTHFIEPIYLASLTLGYLYDHGHLSRAVCCRLQHKKDLGIELSLPFKVNHPLLGRVTAYEASRHTEKTNNLSINWSYEDTSAEVVDGRTGACLSRTRNQPTPARICKAALYELFKGLCETTQRHDLMNFDTYREAKNSAKQFQEAKRLMFECFRKSKYGNWVSKPAEQEMF